ncbi:MAG TPA: SET domain-containing protein-lysine N-methyltransferase [Pyrinomonadaceae bacterium]
MGLTSAGGATPKELIFEKGSEANPRVEVRSVHGFKGVYAKVEIAADSVLIELRGVISTQPDRYSIQLGENRHLNTPAEETTGTYSDFPWKYLNHSCEPNGYVNCADLTFRALREIGRGEELTFNYLTTEYEMASPFECHCGSVQCFGLIRGQKYLTAEQRERVCPGGAPRPSS